MRNNTYTTFELYVHVSTAKARLVSSTGDEDDAIWVPKSQMRDIIKVEGTSFWSIEINDWFVDKEDLKDRFGQKQHTPIEDVFDDDIPF